MCLKKSAVIIFGFICFVYLISCQSVQKQKGMKSSKSILLNNSFEDKPHLRYWKNESSATFCRAMAHSYDGDFAFSVKNETTGIDDAWGVCYQILRDPDDPQSIYPVKTGDMFTFKMWIKAKKGFKGSARLKLEFFKHDRRDGFMGGPIVFSQSEVITDSCDWTEISVSGEVPEGTMSVTAVCVSENMEKGCNYIFFDKGSIFVKKGF